MALTLPDKWAKYRLNLSYPNLRLLRARTGLYSHWDDHEFIDDFSIPQYGLPLYQSGKKAFLDYSPVRTRRKYGLYRSFRWGKNLEIFFLDERSFRSKRRGHDPACRNPATGQPDPFPQLPARLRPQLIPNPAFANFPTAAQCQAVHQRPEPHDARQGQLARFENAIKRSKATFKVVMNEVPIQKMYFVPYDRWEGYNAERESAAAFLQANVKNVVFLTTDLHATLINDVRLHELPRGGRLQGHRHAGLRDRAGRQEHLRHRRQREARQPERREGRVDAVQGAPARSGSACAARRSTWTATSRCA